MRILLTTSLYPTPAAPFMLGGAELFAKRLSEQLVQDGHEVEVLRSRPDGEVRDETVEGVTVRSAGQKNLFVIFGARKSAPERLAWHVIDDHHKASERLAEQIATFRPDVLHSNTLAGLGSDIWRVAAERGVPVVHTLHDYYLTCPRCARFKNGAMCKETCRSCQLMTLGRRRRVRHVSAVVGVSQRIIDIHRGEGLFLETPIQTVVRNASHLTAPIEPEPSEVLRVGFIGRITVDKGLHLLVPALAKLPPSRVKLVIAGRIDEEGKAALRALAPQSDITFLGFVKADEFYRQVDLVVVPSLWEEPGSLVIEEALASGRPVMVSRHGGSPEAVEQDVTGWVVDPETSSMGDLLASLAADPERVRAMQRLLVHGRTHRTMRNVADDYLDVFARARALAKAAA